VKVGSRYEPALRVVAGIWWYRCWCCVASVSPGVCCPYRALVVLSCVGVSVPLEAVNININIKTLVDDHRRGRGGAV
jgi:hypothetical protein